MASNTQERFRPHAAALLFLIKDDQVLLQRRYKTGYNDGNYSLVSGHLDGGEQASKAMLREAYEEAGIHIEPEALKPAHIQHVVLQDREYVDFFFSAQYWSGEIQIMEPDKCDELRWSSIRELPPNLVPNVRVALDNYIQGNFYSEFGWDGSYT